MHAIEWKEEALCLLDQRRLPLETVWIRCEVWQDVAEAISVMAVRGAPAIAISAAWGLVLALRAGADRRVASAGLLAARPTAVNLRWALERLSTVPDSAVEEEARRIHDEDLSINRALGDHGAPLLRGGVLHICNTGALATSGHGTALGMIRSAHEQGRGVHLSLIHI